MICGRAGRGNLREDGRLLKNEGKNELKKNGKKGKRRAGRKEGRQMRRRNNKKKLGNEEQKLKL